MGSYQDFKSNIYPNFQCGEEVLSVQSSANQIGLAVNDNLDITKVNNTLQDILCAIRELPDVVQAKQVYDTCEAAAYLGMSEEWLKKARKTGRLSNGCGLPVFIKIGRSVKYLKSDLDDYLDSQPKLEHLAQSPVHD